MKKIISILMACALMAPISAQDAEPAGEEVSTTLSFSFMSSYFFREVNFGQGASKDTAGKDTAFPVAPAFSSFVEAEMGGLYVGLGQVFAIDKKAHTGNGTGLSATETNILAGITAGNLSFGFGTFIYSGIPGAATGYQAATTEVQVTYDSLFTVEGLSFMLGGESAGKYTYYQLGYSLPELVSGLGIDVIYGGNVVRGTDAAAQLYSFGDNQDSYLQLHVGYGLEVGPGSLDIGVMGQYSLKKNGFDGQKTAAMGAASLGYSLPL
jgi:hypothetical protein